jgi:toxin ParE1/3/4
MSGKGERSPEAAERFFDAMDAKVSLLREYPSSGTQREDIAPGLRVLVERPYLLLHRLLPQEANGQHAVEIVRIVDGRRDLRELFSR